MGEKSVIVDNEDNPIGTKERSEIQLTDIYRVAALWVVNSKNKILIAKRNSNKKNDPGKWGPAVSGTVAQGEEYIDNIVKETQEEIGIDLKKYNFKKIDKIRVPNAKHNFFCQWYLLKEDLDISKFVIQKNEVDEVIWIDRDEFGKRLALDPQKFTISMSEHFAVLKKY